MPGLKYQLSGVAHLSAYEYQQRYNYLGVPVDALRGYKTEMKQKGRLLVVEFIIWDISIQCTPSPTPVKPIL